MEEVSKPLSMNSPKERAFQPEGLARAKLGRLTFVERWQPYSFVEGKTFPGHSGFAAHRSLLDNGSGRQVRLFVQMDGLDQAKRAGFTFRSGFRPC